MHLLIPFAFCSAEGCASVLRTLKLPHLEQALTRLGALPPDEGDEFSLSPPHERALARALGLPAEDGCIPWAAHAQQAEGAWGFLSPCHWQVGSTHIIMSGPQQSELTDAEAQALLASLQPYFAEDGISVRATQAWRWLAHGDMFAGLATASLDRVTGRNLADWLPRGPQAARWQRLQSELQMLLHSHPVNEARQARGLPPVNAFWLSGTGARPAASTATAYEAPLLGDALREAALREDWPAWAQAWQALDATHGRALLTQLQQGRPARLTLCGERSAQEFEPRAQNFLSRLRRRLEAPRLPAILETL